MLKDAFELHKEAKLYTFDFTIVPKLWDDFQIPTDVMEALVWNEVKFLNDDGTAFSDEFDQIPNDQGGIYIFIIKSKVLPGISEYLAYIGRAQLTTNHNLKARCRRYFREYLNEKERPKITSLINFFKKHLYLKYATVPDNETIVRLEAELINSILPPFNDAIPSKVIRQAVNAF